MGEVEGDAAYLFQVVSAARRLPDGRLVVADRGQALIRIYGADGSHLIDFGGNGRGPGEFDYISGLMFHPPDTLAVYDSGLFRLTRFLTDGSVVSTQSFSLNDGRPEIFLGRYSDGAMAFAWIDLANAPVETPGVNPDPMRFGRFDRDGDLELVLGSGTGLRRGPRGVMPFTPQLHAFLFQDTIFHTDGIRPEVRVLDATGGRRTSIPLPLRPVDAGDAQAILREGLEADENEALLERLREIPGDSIPVLSEMLMDEFGRFWVKQYDPTSDINWLGAWRGVRGGSWSIVDRSGRLVATMDLPDELQLLSVHADAVVGLTRDELDVQRVQVFEIRR